MATRGYTHPSGRVSYYDPALTSPYVSGVWATCPLLEYRFDPSIGVLLEDPFVSYDDTKDWTGTQATTGSAAISTTVPGALLMDPGATTAHQGFQIQRKVAAFLPAAGKDIWFETAILAVTGLTLEFFAGLVAVDTTIIASGAMSTNNHIGWTGVAGDGVVQFDCDKGGVSSQTTGVTLSTTVTHKLGFHYDGTADTVQQFIDGAPVGAAIATTYISKSVMYPSFVCQTSGTTQSKISIAGYRVFQLR